MLRLWDWIECLMYCLQVTGNLHCKRKELKENQPNSVRYIGFFIPSSAEVGLWQNNLWNRYLSIATPNLMQIKV